MPRMRVVINHAGSRELLGSAEVRRELHKVAERVAGRAGPDVEVEDATSSGYRAVARVVDNKPGALAREANTGNLARSIDGG